MPIVLVYRNTSSNGTLTTSLLFVSGYIVKLKGCINGKENITCTIDGRRVGPQSYGGDGGESNPSSREARVRIYYKLSRLVGLVLLGSADRARGGPAVNPLATLNGVGACRISTLRRCPQPVGKRPEGNVAA